MNLNIVLTKRELAIAELIAWGAAKKEIADKLCLSVRTIENHTRNIFKKLNIQKSTELCVYWFCTQFGISIKNSPIYKTMISSTLIIVMLYTVLFYSYCPERAMRTQRARTSINCQRRAARNDNDIYFPFND